MSIEIRAVGGYSEVGKNMTAIKIDDEVIICDMGLYLPSIVDYEEEEGSRDDLDKDKLIAIEAVPNDNILEDWKPMVKAIVLSHCHLDHVGAVPYLAEDYKCPIYGTPYTLAILKKIIKDERRKIPNKLIEVMPSSRVLKISDKLSIEFVRMTHSTLQTASIAIHTPYGVIFYANDFKLDNNPIIGKKPDYKRLKQLGDKGVKVLIMDSLYSGENMKTPSEKVAKEMLADIMLNIDSKGKAMFVTTFASHIARLKSILEFGLKLNRKVIFLGRSMQKYITAAEGLGLIDFSSKSKIYRRRKSVNNVLKNVERARDKYLIVCTGNQGEPGSMLRRIAMNETQFRFRKGDIVIFSCKTIPAPANIANRELMETKLKESGVRMFLDIHVSGHGAREDQRELIDLLRPEHIVPSHGDPQKVIPVSDLAMTLGYNASNVHVFVDGQSLKIE